LSAGPPEVGVGGVRVAPPTGSSSFRPVFWTIHRRDRVVRVLSSLMLLAGAGVLLGPFLLLAFLSFNDSRALTFGFRGFTLASSSNALADPRAIASIMSSLLVAGITTPICLFLGTLAAFGVTRFRFRGRGALAGLMGLPLVVPSLLVGVGALVFFIQLDVELSLATVGLMHVAVGFPLVMVIVAAQLYRLDRSLEEAALDLGATRRELIWYVIIPFLVPALAAAAIFAFGWSFNSFTLTYFVIGSETTFPVWVFGRLRRGTNLPVVNAISTLVTVVQVGVVYLAWALLRRSSVRSGKDVREVITGAGPS
jgi:spermidine/putrescine transport system permease protein